MKIDVKRFKELTVEEMYQILRIRSEVFVIEQRCIYQDIDGKDKKAIHVMGTNNNKINNNPPCIAMIIPSLIARRINKIILF